MILDTLEAQTEKMSDRINQINPRIEKVSQQIEVTCFDWKFNQIASFRFKDADAWSCCTLYFLTFPKASAKEIALGEDEPEFSFTGNDISDKLANPDEASKAKKKRKANENAVSSL